MAGADAIKNLDWRQEEPRDQVPGTLQRPKPGEAFVQDLAFRVKVHLSLLKCQLPEIRGSFWESL